MCREVKDIVSMSSGFWFFFAVSVISICLTLWSQKKIISSVDEYEKQMDKLYTTLIQDSVCSPVINVDSICAILNAPGKFKTKDRDVLRYCLTGIDKYVQSEVSKSNTACTMYAAEIKKLLDNQYYRVRQEYEALQTWCAILTIVFLVFSFYSLYKADDMVNQGRKGLNEIETIRRDGQTNIYQIQKDAEKSVSEMKHTIENQVQGMNTRMNEVEHKISEDSGKIDTELKRLKKEVDDKVSDAEKAYTKSLEKKASDLEKQISSARTMIDEAMKSIQGYVELKNFVDQQTVHNGDLVK